MTANTPYPLAHAFILDYLATDLCGSALILDPRTNQHLAALGLKTENLAKCDFPADRLSDLIGELFSQVARYFSRGTRTGGY